MALADDYREQYAWRDWRAAFDALPPLAGTRVLDLGCAIGDQSAALAARGAQVVGVDLDEELLAVARARGLANATFQRADLRTPPELGGPFDGLWSSFAAAYFTDLAQLLEPWSRLLKPGAWVALTEIDDLFGHEPLSELARGHFAAYAREARAAGRYDFHMGGRLRSELERSGFRVERELVLADQEFAFEGPARPDVLAAWQRRFERMRPLRAAFGADYDAVRGEFLECLARPDHRARSRVVCCLAERDASTENAHSR